MGNKNLDKEENTDIGKYVAGEIFEKYFLNNKKFLYEKLSSRNKYIVDNMIIKLLGNRIKNIDINFGENFSEILKNYTYRTYTKNSKEKFTTSYLSKLFNAYASVEKIDYSSEDVKNNFDKFGKNTHKNTDKLVCFLCDVLSVSKEVLYFGNGIQYIIDWDRISEILKERNINEEQFHLEITKKYTKYNELRYNENYITYAEYLFYNQKKYGEFIAKELNLITASEIIFEKEIQLVKEQNYILRYFDKLKDNEQKAIIQLIHDLHLKSQ